MRSVTVAIDRGPRAINRMFKLLSFLKCHHWSPVTCVSGQWCQSSVASGFGGKSVEPERRLRLRDSMAQHGATAREVRLPVAQSSWQGPVQIFVEEVSEHEHQTPAVLARSIFRRRSWFMVARES